MGRATKAGAWTIALLVPAILFGLWGFVSLGRRLGVDRWVFGAPVFHWPIVERMDLELDSSVPMHCGRGFKTSRADDPPCFRSRAASRGAVRRPVE